MNVLEAIRQRREITRYQQRPVEREVLAQLLDAAYLSPTGNNLPSREFILVTDKTMLEHLSQSTPYVPWLKEAAAAIAVTALPDISKYWLQDASIACGFIWLAAVDLGLGAAFGAIYHAEDAEESARRETYVRNALSIPADRRVVAILGLGYPDQQPAPKEPLPREEIIHLERFRTPASERSCDTFQSIELMTPLVNQTTQAVYLDHFVCKAFSPDASL